MLNEPESKSITEISVSAGPEQTLARVGEAVTWVFGRFESELDRDFRHNYLKLSFVKLRPSRDSGQKRPKQNVDELPGVVRAVPCVAPIAVDSDGACYAIVL